MKIKSIIIFTLLREIYSASKYPTTLQGTKCTLINDKPEELKAFSIVKDDDETAFSQLRSSKDVEKDVLANFVGRSQCKEELEDMIKNDVDGKWTTFSTKA